MKNIKQPKMSLIDNLPEELKLEILHKLPIKSIGKCMCVSKYWLSLIKNPTFISTHLKLTSDSDNNLLIFRLTNDRFSLHLDNNVFDHYRVLDLPFEAKNKDFQEYGSCNGIICLVEGYYLTPWELVDKKVILWNPTIRKTLTLPPPNIPLPTLTPLAGNEYEYRVSYGLGFHSSTNDHKLIRILNLIYADAEVPTPEAEIFSLNRNSWRTVTHIFPKYNVVLTRQAFVNGVLHWIGYERLRNGYAIWSLILGLDMGGELFSEIMLPECMADWNPYDIIISVYKESSIGVCFLDFNEYKFMEVWVMREYGKVESWTKIWRLKWDGSGILPPTLGLRNNGELFFEKRGAITSFDPETKEEIIVGFRDSRREDCPVSYFVESLVLLDNVNALSYGDIDAMDDSSDDDSNGDASDAFSE